MLDNFIRGGQIFLHNLTMFKQVLGKSFAVSIIIAICLTGYLSRQYLVKLDLPAGTTYVKASIVQWIHDHNLNLHKNSGRIIPRIDAYTKSGLYMPQASTKNIIKHQRFKTAYQEIKQFTIEVLVLTARIAIGLIGLVFFIWSRYGKTAKETKLLEGGMVLSSKEVASYLRANKEASKIVIDGMPLIKDQETRHILITGMTGSGKTNLINKILPQVRRDNQPAIVVDQTGEMIERYYNPERGDIIFNPFDERSKSWDFWTDCTLSDNRSGINDKLEKFAKILFGFNKKPSGGDQFWDNSAEVVFCACIEYLIKSGTSSIRELQKILSISSQKELQQMLAGTNASRYLENSSATANSILSVMSVNCRPLNYLFESEDKFSIKQYFEEVTRGSSQAWLFFACPPGQREVIMPLIACMMELAVSYLISSGINERRRVWFIIDELASLRRLSSLDSLMTEGRKYGGCVIAGLQSYNQLLDNYGQYLGSVIFGQFATKFMFRCNEPNLAKLMSDMFGFIEYSRQQKNTSYGAHAHRDGISYTEQEKKKPLVASNEFMELKNLECFVNLPDPKIKVAKIQLSPVKDVKVINPGYEPVREREIKEVLIEEVEDENREQQTPLENKISKELDSERPQIKDLEINNYGISTKIEDIV